MNIVGVYKGHFFVHFAARPSIVCNAIYKSDRERDLCVRSRCENTGSVFIDNFLCACHAKIDSKTLYIAFVQCEKGKDLTQSYDECPYTCISEKEKVKRQHKNATQTLI